MMAFGKRCLISCMIMALALQLSMAAVYNVGDSVGWSAFDEVDYQKWADSKTFHVGDTIGYPIDYGKLIGIPFLFVTVFTYDVGLHNVEEVSNGDYESCGVGAPLATYATGNDSVTIKTYGHHFYICGVMGHCQMGQKVDINVVRCSSPVLVPTPPPSSSSSPAPPEQPPTSSPPSPSSVFAAPKSTPSPAVSSPAPTQTPTPTAGSPPSKSVASLLSIGVLAKVGGVVVLLLGLVL
ncbi:hypothetical protein GIB67_027490 [Kingdonia uniflora]|uniref:Phytocyanin domain-containing protein n=1 Tax=Kingdonia uniflora TaxID=39325 RepID=A0A7J7MFD9_9MAGN|nr:hypothetical protein GIB67_027490 [Kingdonia uniflora]